MQVLGTVFMTVNNSLSVLSSSNIVLELKIIKLVIEPPIQALKAIVTLKGGYILQINESSGSVEKLNYILPASSLPPSYPEML
jgi:hypothetical protein